jgi:hypothetical protein
MGHYVACDYYVQERRVVIFDSLSKSKDNWMHYSAQQQDLREVSHQNCFVLEHADNQ